MKRAMSLAIMLCLLVACPLFAGQNRAAARSEQPAVCKGSSTLGAAGLGRATDALGRPSVMTPRMQTTDEGCGLSCYGKILLSTDFGQNVAPYPAFWVKVGVCTAKCNAM